MTYDEFIDEVQARRGLPTRERTETVVRATLQAYADRLEPDFADNLASQLPEELAHHVRGSLGFERLSLDQFYVRILERDTVAEDMAQAIAHARIVTEVLCEAVSEGQFEKLRTQLPEEFSPLFEAAIEGLANRGRKPPS